MMQRRLLLLASPAIAGLLGGCGLEPRVIDSAVMPAGGLGSGMDPDTTAANIAAWAFADSARTYGRPLEGARAAAALEYAAGAFNSSPRWQNVSAMTLEMLLEARAALRQALGVAPGARSQQILDALTGAVAALTRNDRAAAIASLGPPTFPQGGEATLALLGNLPYFRIANVATQRLQNEMFQDDHSDMSL